MGAKDVYEKMKREKQQGDSKAKKVYAQMMQSKIVDEYKSLLKHNSEFYNRTKSRFYDSDGNYIDKYRSDSKDWKDSTVSMSSLAREKSENIKSWLDEYGAYYDNDFVSEINKSLDEHKKYSTDIVSQAVSQYDYFSKYKDEDDYNQKVVIPKKQDEELASADIKALEKELADLEGNYSSYKNLKTERDNLYGTLISGYTRAGYTREGAEQAALNDSRIAKYDKKLSQYGDMSGMDSTISEKKRFYNNATRIQEGIALQENAQNDVDFDKHSKTGGDISNPTFEDVKNHFWLPSGVKKIKNKVTYSRENYDEALNHEIETSDGRPDVSRYGINPLYTQMNEEEVAIYNYYLAKEGEEKADQFLESITETLNYRQAETEFEHFENKWLLEGILAASAGLDQWASGVKSLFNTDGEYVPQTTTQMMGAMAREDLMEDHGIVGQVGYDIVNTTANMLPSILVSTLTGNVLAGAGFVNAAGKLTKGAAAVSKLAGAATLGSSAAGNGYQEMLNLGYDKSQAQAYGTLVGVSEASLEYLIGGISSLGGKWSGGITDKVVTKLISNVDNAIAKVAIGAGGKLVGSMVSEFGEEYLQEVLNPVFKNITLNTDEDIKLFSSEALYSGILGALSAGLLEGGTSISGEVKTYKAGKDVKKTGQLSNLKKLGTSYSADSVAYQIANKVDENTDAYTIGTLLHEVGADSLSEANIADITKSLERKGIPTENAQTIAKWLDAAVQGENFSPLQRLALKNPDISQTFKDVVINQNSTVNQRQQAYNDVLMNIAKEKTALKDNAATQKAKAKADKAKTKADKKAKKTEVTEENKATPFTPYSNEEIARRIAQGEEINLGENKSTTDSKNAVESKFEVNLDGQTVNTKTGDTINVTEIASIDNGKMTLKLENGDTVDADDISFGTRDDAIIYTSVLDMGVNAAVANSLVKNFKAGEGVSADRYVLGINEAYKYGFYSIPETEISKNGFAADLSEAQRKHAYNLGKIDAVEKSAKAQTEVKKSGSGSVRGKVHFSGDKLKLNQVRSESLKRMEILSDVLGVEFHVFESYVDKNGRRVYKDTDGTIKKAPNGYYKNGNIYIDLNAGSKGQGVMIYTVAHELGHFIKEWSPAKFKILADFLMEQYGEKGVSVNNLVEAQIEKAKRNRRTIDYDEAYEEVICDSLETMLNDDKVIEKIQLLKVKDEGLVAKIKEFFEKLAESFHKLMQQYPPETPEGKLVAEMTKSLDKLQTLFAEALVDASNNYQAPGQQKNTTSEGDVKKSLREMAGIEEFDKQTLNNIKMRKGIVVNTMTELEQHIEKALARSGKQNLYFGIISNNTKNKISKDVNAQVFKDKPYSFVISYDDIIHISEHFGTDASVIANEIIRLYDIIENYDTVELVIEKNTKKLVFDKSYSDYDYRTVEIASNSKSTLDLVTLFITKNNIKRRGQSSSPVTNESDSQRGSTSSMDSISQTSKKSQEKMSGRDNSIGERNLEDFAEAKDTDGKTLFQYRAMEADEDTYREMLKTANIMNDTEIDSLFDTIDKAMDIIKDNLEALDYAWDTNIDDRAFSPVKKNTDKLYQVSVDFSTLCRKRLLQQSIQAHLQDALNRPLTKAEGIAIRDALMTIQEEGKKIEIACALCYVESARMKSPAQIKRFVDDRETVIKNHFAAKSDKVKAQLKEAEAKTRKRLSVDDTPLTKLPSNLQKEIRAAKKDVISSYVPSAKEQELIEIAKGMSVNDFVTPKGLENLIKTYPDLFEAYASYIVNATHSKGIENDTWWRAGDSKNIGDTLIANMNAENGLRSQSWSDFQVIHLLDYIAATIELSTRKAKMQAYTKVPDFVELMGNTGEMINLSLIPTRHFNGALEFDSVEGMAFEESLRLRDKYHATTGTIAIGVDNVQIQMLLDSMDIDYVIPYHRSGMSKAVRKAMHIPTWDEYENHQSEKNLSRDDAKRQAKKYGVKLLSESDSNYQKHPNFSDWFDITEARQIAKMENANPSDKAMQKKYGVMYGGYMAMQNAANNYLKLCAERGISPKFSYEGKDFTVEDNYWKLLIDRKMVDNVTGEVIEQQAVKPIFDQNEILRILNDELERYPTVKADQDYATRKVAEHFLSGNIKGGMSAEAIAKAMKKPVDNVAKVNILASVEDSKLSDRDSNGNELSKEQQEFFKDSKVRDANGNLLVVYHGSPKGNTTIFDKSKTSKDNDMGQGIYFSTNINDANEYRRKTNAGDMGNSYRGKMYSAYVNIENPFVVSENEKISLTDALNLLKLCEDRMIAKDVWYDLNINAKDGYVTTSQLANSNISTHMTDILAKSKKYDGIIDETVSTKFGLKEGTKHIVVLNSNQIKETTNTNPTSNPDIRYSDRVTLEENAEYMEAYFDGDEDLMQELVDKVANRLGYKYKAYHHTENGFTVFDLSKARANMDIQGFYFSADMDAESEYGSVRYDTYLKMDNPFIVDSTEKRKAIPFDMSKENAGIIAREWLQSHGYDGVIRKAEYYGAEADEYIVFDSSQIKSAEPVTYADDEYGEGDVIPLSERFNAENEDIRYSDRDIEVYDRTAILKESTIDKYLEDYAAKFSPNYAQAYITYMSPDKFLKMTTSNKSRIEAESKEFNYDKFTDATLFQPIQLTINSKTGEVIGHEGRHRMVALSNAGVYNVPVLMFDYSNKTNKENLSELVLHGQFNSYLTTRVQDVIPFNYVNREEIIKNFGTQSSWQKMKERYDGEKTLMYSDRDSKTDESIEKINKQLAKENVKLIEDVKYLKELVKLQGKETHGKILKKSSIELVAKRLMAYSNAKGNVSELASHLSDVYNYIIQGEDVSWEGIQDKSKAAVDWLMRNEDNKPIRDELANEILTHLRKTRISLDPKQKQETAYWYGSFNAFHKKSMGRLKIVNDGMPLDSAWKELAEMYPMYFDEEVSSNDQPIMLMDIIDRLQNTYELDEYHYYSEEMVRQDLLTKVYEGYWDVSTIHTVADAKQKEIYLLKTKHKEQMDSLRQSHQESDAKLRQEHKDKISQLRTQYKEREEKKIQKVAEYYQKSRKEAVDRVKETREKRDAITKLQKLVLDTAKWLSYPKKDDVKCPDILRSPYAEFLSSVDLSSKRLLTGGEPTQNDLRVSSAMDSLAKAIEKKLGTQNPNTETETVLDTGYLDLPVHFVENLKETAENLKKRMEIDGHIVNAMTSEEIKALTQLIKTLNHSIKEMSTLYNNMRFAKVEELGGDSITFLDELGEANQTNAIANFVTWDNALPYYTFKRFGVGGESVFEELMDAQDKLAYLADEIFKFKEKTWTDKEAKAWSEDTHTIDLPSGSKLTLTTTDAMSIYCLSRREQGRQHLLGGGVRVLGIEKNGKKAKDSRSTLNQQDVLAIASSLTERQIKVAEAIQEFMSTVCADWGNEISMKRFLTKEFTEKFYFPIESNDENLDTKDPTAQQSDLYRLLNISATKPLTRGANNEVIIRNIFDVFTGHSTDMARLNAFGMPLLDYMKWLNYREKFTNEEGQINVRGVRKSMERAYGSEAKKYAIGLIKDINGRSKDGGDHPFLMKMTRVAKTAMVGANLRVSLLQFTAYPRAAMVLSSKSLALGLTKKPQIEKAKKYCGIALWKSFGFYDTNISRSIEDQLKGTTNIRQKLIELSLKGAEWGDAITWGCLWNACEYEVAKTKQYKVGSEEFNQAVGKKLREVVYSTQVVDSVLTRSQMMRNKSGLTQSASAFMSEPTLSANILMDAGFQFNLEKRRTGLVKLAWKKVGKHIGKAVAVYCIGQTLAALAEAIADAYRDDEDEEFMTKFGKAFAENAISDLNPFNKIPIIADVSDLILSWFGVGFSNSNSLYLQAINEASNAFETWSKVINGEDGKTVYSGIYSTTKLLSYITGVSASGLMREVVTLWNNTAGAADPYLKIRTYETSATDKGIAEYKFDKGDTTSVKTTVSKMVADKVKSGKTEKEAKSAVRASFTSTYKPEYIAAVKAKDYDEMNHIRKFLYATGLYGTLSELDEDLKKWRTAE